MPAYAAERRALGGDLQRPIIIALFVGAAGRELPAADAASLLPRNLLIYGSAALSPVPGIWAIDQLLVLFISCKEKSHVATNPSRTAN